MEIYCYGTARVRHAVTGEVYSISADELDWQDAGGDERPMGPAFHHEAMVEHPELGLMSWGVGLATRGALLCFCSKLRIYPFRTLSPFSVCKT